jgi:hypothetical protein
MDGVARDTCLIQLRLHSLGQLFNSMDPSPFTERDLDDEAADFIIAWAQECHRHQQLALEIRIDAAAPAEADDATVIDAVHNYFAYRADMARLQLREHLRQGPPALAIGLLFLAVATLASRWVGIRWPGAMGQVASEGLLVGGWVAMWRPFEIYLYGWLPIRRRRRLLQRLATMPVCLLWRDRPGSATVTGPA